MKDALLFLPRLVYKLYFFLFFLITLVLFYPIFKWSVSKSSRFITAFSLMRNWSWWLSVAAGIKVNIVTKSSLPKNGPYIICSNHTSYLDIVLMYRVFSDYFIMMGKGEIENWPFFRVFFTSGMNILVYRNNNKKAHNSIQLAKEKIDQGNNVVIFPEGGIYDHAPQIKGLKNGAFKLAIEKQVPIVPITFETNWKLLQGTSFFEGKAGPGECRVHIHEFINTEGLTLSDLPDLRTKVRNALLIPLDKHL